MFRKVRFGVIGIDVHVDVAVNSFCPATSENKFTVALIKPRSFATRPSISGNR